MDLQVSPGLRYMSTMRISSTSHDVAFRLGKAQSMLGTIEEKIAFTQQTAAAAASKQEAQLRQRQRLELELENEDVKQQHKQSQDSRAHQACTAPSPSSAPSCE